MLYRNILLRYLSRTTFITLRNKRCGFFLNYGVILVLFLLELDQVECVCVCMCVLKFFFLQFCLIFDCSKTRLRIDGFLKRLANALHDLLRHMACDIFIKTKRSITPERVCIVCE